MLFGSLILTISTCLSGGCIQISNAVNIENIENNALCLISKAAENYDFSEYDLNYSEEQSLIKQKLFQYAQNNELFTVNELNRLQETIVNDSEYKLFNDIDSLFLQGSNTNINLFKSKNSKICENIYKKTGDIVSHDDTIVSNFLIMNNENASLYSNTIELATSYIRDCSIFDNSIIGETEGLPLLPYNINNVSSSVNGKLDGVNFLGVLCSKDTCINLYNSLAGWLNQKAMYVASGVKTPVGIIVDALNLLQASIVTGTIISSSITTITGAFATLWAQFCALFSTGGPIGIIIGIIIGLVGVACIGIIVSMIVYGFLGKGFAIGWKVHNVFKWEWFCGGI